MKHILYITQPGSGGVRKHLCDLLENLDLTKYKVSLIYNADLADENFKATLAKLNGQISTYSLSNLTREISPKTDFAAYREVSKIIKQIKPDIVHTHSSKAGVIGRLAAKKHHVKQIYYTPHAYAFLAPEFSSKKKLLFVTLERYLSKHNTSLTFTVSEGEKAAALANKIDKADKFKVIYNGVPDVVLQDKSSLRQKLHLSDERYIFGTIGRLSPQKNPDYFAKLAEKYPEYDFVWIGGKQETSLKNLHFLGELSNAADLLPVFDSYISTALYEGLPYAPIEALRAGIPVFLSNVVGNQEIIKSDNGKLYEFDQLLNDENQIKNYVKWARNVEKSAVQSTFQQYFSIQQMLKQLTEIYDEN